MTDKKNAFFRALVLPLSLLLAACGSTPQNTPRAPGGYDVVLLAGQSNMAGRGAIPSPLDEDGQPDPSIMMWDPVRGIVPAKDPIIHTELGNKPTAVGMGLTFAKAYLADAKRRGEPERKVLLVGAAWGGTGFSEDVPQFHHRWVATDDPAIGGDLYRAAVQRANAAIQAAQAQDSSSRFRGILWHQGESDANKAGSANYAQQHKALMNALRMNISGAVGTPLVVGEMTPCFMVHCNAPSGKAGPDAYRRQVFDYIHDIAAQVPNSAWVSSEGLASNGPKDEIHFNTASQRELGRRYAQKFSELLQSAAAKR
ncbi:sialate O-acetylesterase [Roseateles sp.]|uniref:sialate O-acetylesterase n=1 Tax=Roseateles sp. TaxID=1971397 RepID=UPI003BA4E179